MTWMMKIYRCGNSGHGLVVNMLDLILVVFSNPKNSIIQYFSAMNSWFLISPS